MDTRPRDGRVLGANANADPDTNRLVRLVGLSGQVRLGRLVCSAHLEEMNIAEQLSSDRRCAACGESSPFGLRLHECGAPRRKGRG